MTRHCYYFIDYKCHVETCCHDEHFTYAVYRVEPNRFGPYSHTPKECLGEFHTEDECRAVLEGLPNNYGLADPYMRG